MANDPKNWLANLKKKLDEFQRETDPSKFQPMKDKLDPELEYYQILTWDNQIKAIDDLRRDINKSAKDTIESNKELAKKTNTHSGNLVKWTFVLGLATAILAGVGFLQWHTLNKYTKATQDLATVSQKQLDLELQPFMYITSTGSDEKPNSNLFLSNYGSAGALNMEIISSDPKIKIVGYPATLFPVDEKILYFVPADRKYTGMTREQIKRLGNPHFSYNNNEPLVLTISYDNVVGRKFTQLITITNDNISYGSKKD